MKKLTYKSTAQEIREQAKELGVDVFGYNLRDTDHKETLLDMIDKAKTDKWIAEGCPHTKPTLNWGKASSFIVGSLTTITTLAACISPVFAWEGQITMPGRTSEGAAITLQKTNVFPGLSRASGAVDFTYFIDHYPDDEHSDAINLVSAVANCNTQKTWTVYKRGFYGGQQILEKPITVQATSNVSKSLLKAACSLR